MIELSAVAWEFITDPVRIAIVLIAFAYFSWLDVKTRRIPNKYWPPLLAAGFLFLLYDLYTVHTVDALAGLPSLNFYLISALITILFTTGIAVFIWWIGAFGGADAKALITLAVLFPTTPTLIVPTTSLPIAPPPHDIFTLTILTNAVLIVPGYLTYLAASNLLFQNTGINRWIFFARPVPINTLLDRHGKLVEDSQGRTTNGVDIDTIKNYVRWKNADTITNIPMPDKTTTDEETETDDPWDADEFIEQHNNHYTPDDAEKLRSALDNLTSKDTVWITPGLPFITVLYFGILLSLTLGSTVALLVH